MTLTCNFLLTIFHYYSRKRRKRKSNNRIHSILYRKDIPLSKKALKNSPVKIKRRIKIVGGDSHREKKVGNEKKSADLEIGNTIPIIIFLQDETKMGKSEIIPLPSLCPRLIPRWKRGRRKGWAQRERVGG